MCHELEQAFLKEILLLYCLDHPSTMKFLGVSCTIDGLGSNVCIILPWYANGTVENVLREQPYTKEFLPRWVSLVYPSSTAL